MKNQKEVVRTDVVQSSSNAAVTYEVKTFVDGTFWCPCASFKFQKKVATDRCCKHTKQVVVAMATMQFAQKEVA